MCECAASMRGGSSAAELRARGCAACSARTFAFDGTQRAVSSKNYGELTSGTAYARPLRLALPPHGHQACFRTPKVARMDFTPAAGWVEGHLGAARFLCMTCIEWVVKPAAAMTWRIR